MRLSLGAFVAIAGSLLPEILEANLGDKVSAGRHLVAGAFENVV